MIMEYCVKKSNDGSLELESRQLLGLAPIMSKQQGWRPTQGEAIKVAKHGYRPK